MPPTPVLQTPRLVLRPVRSKDAPVIQRRFPHWEVVRWLNAKIPWPYPADGAATYVATCLEEMARGEKSHWAIVPKKGPADLIGIIDLWPDDGVSRDQRGFWLDPAFQGRGLMTEAADRVTDYAFRELGWPCLWLSNAQDNHRLAPHQGEAGRATGRHHDRPLRRRRGLADGLAADARGLGRPPGGLSLAGSRASRRS